MICSSIWSRLSGILTYQFPSRTAPHRVEADPGQHRPRPTVGLPHLWRQASPQPHQQGRLSLSELQYYQAQQHPPPVTVQAQIMRCRKKTDKTRNIVEGTRARFTPYFEKETKT